MSTTAISKAPKVSGKRSRVVKRTVKGGFVKVSIGDVTVVVNKPSKEQVRRNVQTGVRGLERLAATTKKGIALRPRKGVPFYAADPDQPGVYIRKLDGKIERGVLKDGAFKVCP